MHKLTTFLLSILPLYIISICNIYIQDLDLEQHITVVFPKAGLGAFHVYNLLLLFYVNLILNKAFMID